VSQSVNGNVQRELLAVIGADAFAFIAGVVGAEGTAEAILTHDRDEISLIEQALELDVSGLVQAADVVDLVE
jgi:hypothetical protein